MSIRWQQHGGLGQYSPEAIYALNQQLPYGTVSPIHRIHWFKNQQIEKRIVPFPITLSDPLEKNLFLIPTTLNSVGLEVLVPDGVVFLPRAMTNIALNRKLRLPPGHVELLKP